MSAETPAGAEPQPGISAEHVAEDAFAEVLHEAVAAVTASGAPYLLMGGFASAALGRERWTHDIDFFVKPEDARHVLRTLALHDFATEETDQAWLYKAYRKGVLVDVIFCSADEIYLDDSMLEHAHEIEFKGSSFRVIPPEDLLIIKSRVFKEETPRHWFDALGIVSVAQLDWDYLVQKAREKPEKPLSVLLFARAAGLQVPSAVLQKLWDAMDKRHDSHGGPAGEPDEYVAARIHERLVQEGLEVDVCVEDGMVLLTGEASTAERRTVLEAIVSEMAHGRRVVNQTTVLDLDEPQEVEQVN